MQAIFWQNIFMKKRIKSDYIYYLKGLNQSNYNEDEFKERMEQNFDIIE